MAKCIRCGNQAGIGRRMCYDCRQKWLKGQLDAYNAAEAVLGPDCAENHDEFVRLVKQAKRTAAKGQE